jgi:FkbM family methyltransferase
MSAFSIARNVLQNVASKYGLQIERKYDFGVYRLDVLELLVERVGPRDPDFFVIQVGANDGEENDPINQMIRRYNWRGILLEPQPDVFRSLVKNYNGYDHLIFENAALASSDGELPFFTIPGQTGLGSFDKAVLHRSGFKDSAIVKGKVAAITASTLLKKHHVERVDLLQVDTEGFDFEVIKMILSANIRPKIINYEHLHLSNVDRAACVDMLGSLGYKMLQAGPLRIDTVAFYTPDCLEG